MRALGSPIRRSGKIYHSHDQQRPNTKMMKQKKDVGYWVTCITTLFLQSLVHCSHWSTAVPVCSPLPTHTRTRQSPNRVNLTLPDKRLLHIDVPVANVLPLPAAVDTVPDLVAGSVKKPSFLVSGCGGGRKLVGEVGHLESESTGEHYTHEDVVAPENGVVDGACELFRC